MLESPVLREPGAQGVFEPNTTSIGLSFQPNTDLDTLFRPTADNWRETHTLFHELVHFYQFSTTSWGLLHQLLGRAEFVLMSGFLREYADGEDMVTLPLLRAGRSIPLQSAFDRGDPRALLRCAYLLDRMRRHIFGYEPAPRSPFAGDDRDEYWQLLDILHGAFGVPKIGVFRSKDFRSSEQVMPPSGYRIDDLLESHAHALSSLWMFQAVERYGLDEEIGESVLRAANREATGPYGSLLRFAGDLPVDEKTRLNMFCVLCDLALNAVDAGPILGQMANPAGLVHISDELLDPVTNCLQLLAGTIDGQLPTLCPGGTKESVVGEYLDGVSSVTTRYAHLLRDSVGIDDVRSGPLVASLQSQGDLLNTVTLDAVGSFTEGQQLRREHHPLLLGGVMIEDIEILLSRLAMPNVLAHLGSDPAQSIPLFRPLVGLVSLGFLEPDDIIDYSARANADDIGVVSTIRNLLLMTRAEMDAADGVTFGINSQKPSALLQAWWGLHLDDFE